jgi:hypothetical protein
MYYSNLRRKRYIVPAGTKSDLASVPRLPLVFWLVGRRGDAAGILHDHLYEEGMRLKQVESRAEADDVFYEALLDLGVNGGLAYMMFTAVRAAGAPHFTRLAAAMFLALALSGCSLIMAKQYQEMTPEQIKSLQDAGMDVYSCITVAGPPPSGKFVYVWVPRLDKKPDVRFGENCAIR